MTRVVLSLVYGGLISSEELIAEIVTEDTARIISVPFCSEKVSPGDLVKHVNGKIVEVVESVNWLRHVFCDAEISEFAQYFKEYNISVEPLGQMGVFHYGLVIPNSVTDAELEKILKESPWTILRLPYI